MNFYSIRHKIRHKDRYKGHLDRMAFIQSHVAQLVQHRTTNLKVVGSSPTVGKTFFHFVFCRFRRAPGRSTGPIQMKSSVTLIRRILMHREIVHLKEKWRRYYIYLDNSY